MATLILRDTHRVLEEEMKSLNKEKRETSVRIREAADQGDLKENAEYHAAREHQSLLVYKIQLMQSHAPFKIIGNSEITTDENSETNSPQFSEEQPLQTQEVVLENKQENEDTLVLENEYNEENKVSNGLENFELEDHTPELFNSENSLETESKDQEFSSFKKEENNDEEDELEIPAFLRRQKN